MRAADQFRSAGLRDRRPGPLFALLEEQREEGDLEEDVSQLVHHGLGVVAVRRVGQLVGLLTVCGTIERASCSRSQGHSRRRRRVTSSRCSKACI
jgi:hypothetical protein